jgi:hypothetical protein
MILFPYMSAMRGVQDMPHTIELTAETFARLQKHAIPLVDTFESLVNRILDIYEKNGGPEKDDELGSDGDLAPVGEIKDFKWASPPDLTHTKVLAAEFCKVRLSKTDVSWNGLLNEAIRIAKKRTKSEDEFKRLILVNFVMGKKDDEGYRYLADIGVSVQGQDSNAAWKAVFYIAKQLGCQFEVVFTWRMKKEAAHPGITGRFTYQRVRLI